MNRRDSLGDFKENLVPPGSWKSQVQSLLLKFWSFFELGLVRVFFQILMKLWILFTRRPNEERYFFSWPKNKHRPKLKSMSRTRKHDFLNRNLVAAKENPGSVCKYSSPIITTGFSPFGTGKSNRSLITRRLGWLISGLLKGAREFDRTVLINATRDSFRFYFSFCFILQLFFFIKSTKFNYPGRVIISKGEKCIFHGDNKNGAIIQFHLFNENSRERFFF